MYVVTVVSVSIDTEVVAVVGVVVNPVVESVTETDEALDVDSSELDDDVELREVAVVSVLAAECVEVLSVVTSAVELVIGTLVADEMSVVEAITD